MHPSASGGVPASLPVVRLIHDEQNRLIVAAPSAVTGRPDPGPTFDPFPLPPLPLSLHCWLTGLAAEFHRRHRRCLAALLLLDCEQRRWVQPLVPAQACGRDGAAWTLDPGNAPRPHVHRRVAGSFQTRDADDLFDAAGSVPQLDGLHLVQALMGKAPISVVFMFLHAEGETNIVAPDNVMHDDWDEALIEAAGRMTID